MNHLSVLSLIQSIHHKLKLANFYFQEHKEIIKQRDSDNGILYLKYNFSLPFIQKAYFEHSILILCTLFEKDGEASFVKLRTSLEKSNAKLQSLEEKFVEVHRVIKGLKTIRNKSIAHTDNIDIEKLYEEANLTFQDIDILLSEMLSYLKYLTEQFNTQLVQSITYPYNREFGIKQIYDQLK